MGAGAGSVRVTVYLPITGVGVGAVIMCILLFNFTSRACDCGYVGVTEWMSAGLSVWNLCACAVMDEHVKTFSEHLCIYKAVIVTVYLWVFVRTENAEVCDGVF